MLQDSLNCKKLNKAKNKDLNNEEEPLSILEEEMGEEEGTYSFQLQMLHYIYIYI